MAPKTAGRPVGQPYFVIVLGLLLADDLLVQRAVGIAAAVEVLVVPSVLDGAYTGLV